ncbi:hypothetical protein [uncultured Pelagimonas sp.]|uniref:hypothetical protein n=1 Tax=uncultured Pelagimonas sp. TaxID=1618102 RepID=UPI00260C64B1|nr:hypothetical protein [uncultured Pelagimonas sp.]
MRQILFETDDRPSEGTSRARAVLTEAGHKTDWLNIGHRRFMLFLSACDTSERKPDPANNKREVVKVKKVHDSGFQSVCHLEWRDHDDTDEEATRISRLDPGVDLATFGEEVPGGGFIRVVMETHNPGEEIYAEIRTEAEDNKR